jgi:hypothetical protein
MAEWAGAFAFASLCFACAIYYTATAWFAHRERMAKIEKGIDPGEAPFSGIKVQIKKGLNPDQPPQ